MKKIITTTTSAILFILLFGGWGSTGHKIINSNITICFPAKMAFPESFGNFLTAHASDPDNRKNSDNTESPRHFIDIDNYSEFNSNGFISQNYDSVVLIHTSKWVIKQGTLPWAIVKWEDSLKNLFMHGNWTMAQQVAADLGHYVGDSHQPLHNTQNYDGGSTNQDGVHSRYETTLVGVYQGSIVYPNDEATYVSNVSDYTFKFLYYDYKFLDSVLYSDSVANSVAGSTSGTVYQAKFWELAGPFTIDLMKNASKSTADLIYTAWIDAGSPAYNSTSVNGHKNSPLAFNLNQNYPNPFNPSTSISYSVARRGNVTLKVFNILGNEVALLVNEDKEAGNYNINFNASGLPSGVYFYRLTSAGFDKTLKMIYLK